MPIEYTLLKYAMTPFPDCPKCKKPFEPFLRGMVQSFWRGLFGRAYCAVICRSCKKIIGWEKP